MKKDCATTNFYYFKIYSDLKKLPKKSLSESIAHRLPDDLVAHPLSMDVSVQDACYVYESVETHYLATESDFDSCIAKLKHIIRYSIWQPDAYEPGPFRDLIWPGEFVKRESIHELLLSFEKYDKEIRALNDTSFYKVYCALRKAILRFSEIASSTNTVILGEIERISGLKPLDNSIERPFQNIELDFEGKFNDDFGYVSNILYNGLYNDAQDI